MKISNAILCATVAICAVTFWLIAGSSSYAAPGSCTLCHKRTNTIVVPCASTDYDRHIDHGDTIGACSATRTATDSKPKD